MTHILSEITIRNFKSIIDETLELAAFTPLVGYNNAGKSNILEAIKWLLRSGSLSEIAFHDKTVAVEMGGKISGISAVILSQLPTNQQAAIQPYLFSDTLAGASVFHLCPKNASVFHLRIPPRLP